MNPNSFPLNAQSSPYFLFRYGKVRILLIILKSLHIFIRWKLLEFVTFLYIHRNKMVNNFNNIRKWCTCEQHIKNKCKMQSKLADWLNLRVMHGRNHIFTYLFIVLKRILLCVRFVACHLHCIICTHTHTHWCLLYDMPRVLMEACTILMIKYPTSHKQIQNTVHRMKC